MKRSLFFLTLGLVVVALIQTTVSAEPATLNGLSLLAFVAVLWLSEVIHITLTALLIPVLATVFGLLDMKAALSSFADPIIFLFLGGFALAAALHKCELDHLLAARIIRLSGGRPVPAAFLLCGIAAGMSMWISNTATTAIMLPLALGLLRTFRYESNPDIYHFLLLGIAYSASIGGIATLVGSPPNAIVAAELKMSFMDWLKIGAPMTAVLLPAMLLVLWLSFRPRVGQSFDSSRLASSGRLDKKQIKVLAIFAAAVTGWVFSKPLSVLFGVTDSFDTLVAIAAIIALGVTRAVHWKDVESTTDWGVLLLFGGGITLSAVLKSSGASAFLAQLLANTASAWPLFLLLMALVAFVVFLTELSSNTASTALLVPIFVAIAQALGLDHAKFAIAIGISASCAFMLPVATPPNALVHGTGLVPQRTMIRIGFRLNLLFILIISGLIFLLF